MVVLIKEKAVFHQEARTILQPSLPPSLPLKAFTIRILVLLLDAFSAFKVFSLKSWKQFEYLDVLEGKKDMKK